MSEELKLKLNIAMGIEGDKVVEHFKTMAREISRLGNQVTLEVTRAVAAQTGGVGGPAAAVNAVTGGLTAAAGGTGGTGGAAATTDLNRIMLGLVDTTKKVGEEFTKTDKKKRKLDKNLKQATETSKGFARSIVEMGGKLRSVSRLFFYASLDLMQFANVILGPMMYGLRIWLDYEKALARVFVNVEAMGQDGSAAMNLLGDAITEMSDSWEFSQLQIAQAAAVLGQARIPVDDIIESLEDLAGIARVNFIELDQAAQITLRIMRQFRISLEDATSEMWRMSAIAQHTGESIDNIVNAMGYATEGGQLLEFTFAEIATSMTLLTEKYGSASIAGRRLSTVYSRLMQVGEEYGIQLQALDGSMLSQREQIASLADYLDLIGDPIEQNQYLIALFGRTGADAARTLVDAFKEGRLDKVMADTGDNMIDAMKDVAQSMEQLSYVSVADLSESIKDLAMKISQSLAPAIKTLADDLVPIITRTAKFVTENKDAILAVGALGLAIAGLAQIIKILGFGIEIIVAVATVIGGLAGGILILEGAAIQASIAIGGPLSAAVSALIVAGLPLEIILLAIIALVLIIVGIIYGFVTELDKLGTVTTKTGEEFHIFSSILKFLGSLLNIIVKVILIIVGALVGLGVIIGKAIVWVMDLFGAIDQLVFILELCSMALDHISDFLDDAVAGVQDFLGGFLPGSPTLAQRIAEVTSNLTDMVSPLQATTQWARRLNTSMGAMKSNASLDIGMAVGQGVASGMTGAGQQGGLTVNMDGAYVQDPEDLARMIVTETVRESKRSYRRGPY